MLVLAIWLSLIGYSVLITGKRNLSISYQPQADGSISAVDSQGKPAKSFGVFDVLTCGSASGQLSGTQPTKAPTQRQPATPPLLPNLVPQLVPEPITLPNLTPPAIPRGVPIPGVRGGLGILDTVARDVHDILEPVVTGIEDEWSRLRFPGLVTARPRL